ncbi:bifunctional riboflavin kinase/FAD synthetase [bacterium]|nr:bifunctional riboflavin kinase/FAD synthetase [bacterium]
MRVLRSIEQVRELNLQNTALTIGSFDGVHVGHQKLISETLKCPAKGNKCVMTFDPHPAKVLSPQPPPLLFSQQDQIDTFKSLGIDILFFLPFTKETAALTAEHFVDKIIWSLFHPSCLVVGYNFTFGNQRKGDFDFLQQILKDKDVSLFKVSPVSVAGEIVSSSRIRQLLAHGKMELIQECLGRAYYLEGSVIEGKKLGRTLGFPTVNLNCKNEIFPHTGVYFCSVCIEGKTYKAVGNIGYNPTVSSTTQLKIEFHILDFSGDLYKKFLRFQILKKLRDEMRFESKESLRVQIGKDIDVVRKL